MIMISDYNYVIMIIIITSIIVDFLKIHYLNHFVTVVDNVYERFCPNVNDCLCSDISHLDRPGWNWMNKCVIPWQKPPALTDDLSTIEFLRLIAGFWSNVTQTEIKVVFCFHWIIHVVTLDLANTAKEFSIHVCVERCIELNDYMKIHKIPCDSKFRAYALIRKI